MIRNKLNAVPIGLYNETVKNKVLTPAGFYFILDDILFVFDYSILNDSFFGNNAEKFSKIKKIVLCFSQPCIIDGAACTPMHYVYEFINGPLKIISNRYISAGCPIEIKTYFYYSGEKVYKLIYQDNQVTNIENITYRDNNMAFSGNDNQYIITINYDEKSYYYTGFTVYKNSIDNMLLFYSGKSGEMNEYNLSHVAKNKNALLVYYLNTKINNFMVEKLKFHQIFKYIEDKFDNINNDKLILGYMNKGQAKYFIERMETI